MDLNILNSEEDLKIEFGDLKPICRCCLSKDKRMKSVVPYEPYFVELAGITVSQADGLPQWLCWECLARLQKAVKFKQKVLRAHSLLYEHLTRCAPFPIDTSDPELFKYATPELKTTETLTYDSEQGTTMGFHENLTHNTSASSFPSLAARVSPSRGEPTVKIEDVEVDFEYDDDDDITLEKYRESSNRLTDEDLKLLLEDPGPIEEDDPEPKKKRKTKKKKEEVKKGKRRKTSGSEPEEPKTSVRKREELDPTKIRVVKLDPAEQMRQREEENKSSQRFPFHCHLCFQGFNFEVKLENHMKKHSPSRGPYKCKFCQMHLPTPYSLEVHLLIHTQRYECVQCGRRMIDRASMMDHYRTVHEGIVTMFTCHICGKVSNNSKTHRGHMRNVHESGDRPKCDQCGKTFVNKDGLIEHLLIHQGIKNYECNTCGKRFRTRAQITHHQLKHTDVRDYYCVECDIRFKSASSLRQHLMRSSKHKDINTFKFSCPTCSKRFETDRALRHHVAIQHEGSRAYRCALCPAALASPASLRKHRARVHAGLRPPPRHVCDACGKAFHNKSVLVNHARTHTGEKPFACTICGRGFSQKAAMKTHVKLVHLKIRRRAKVAEPPAAVPKPEAWAAPKPEPWPAPAPQPDIYFHIAA